MRETRVSEMSWYPVTLIVETAGRVLAGGVCAGAEGEAVKRTTALSAAAIPADPIMRPRFIVIDSFSAFLVPGRSMHQLNHVVGSCLGSFPATRESYCCETKSQESHEAGTVAERYGGDPRAQPSEWSCRSESRGGADHAKAS